MIRAVRRFQYLYLQLVRRELRQKYKGSALGVLWYLINPLALMTAYYLMFSLILDRDDIEDYPLFLLIGITIWVLFSQSLIAGATSLIEQSALVRKVQFPREIVTAAVVSVQFVIFGVLLVLVVPVTVAVRGTLGPEVLLVVPIALALGAFVLGLSLAAAILHSYFRDVAPILAAALLPWFFISPIFFRPTDFPGLAERPLLGDLLRWGNPVAPFIEALRDVTYEGRVPDASVLLYVLVAAVLALVGGRALFKRLESELAVVL
jgi:lipopolysaccharide transport system permease protein